eukprot:TRINITY_DN7234_c0_g1_i4.p1 TRINITY_DN7234_c0_g1~~TRINITY_DN7234_c0_g1_i4.p1  ORF type:complete len:382 (+),score=60.10 TRINITY_DN7234_c0_g1_i4:37-1182(+)
MNKDVKDNDITHKSLLHPSPSAGGIATSHAASATTTPHQDPSSLSDDAGPDFVLLSKYFVAGAAARISAATLMSPIDTVKTRLQFQGRHQSIRRYASTADAFKTILKEEGIIGFYKGLPPRLIYITPAAAVSFMFYEQFKILLYLQRDKRRRAAVDGKPMDQESEREMAKKYRNRYLLPGSGLHPAVPLIAGGLARLIGTACRTPFDIIRQRLQVQGTLPQHSQYKNVGTFGAMKLLLKTEGVGGLWTGYSITVLRDAPFAAIYFLSYEMLKEVQHQLTGIPEEERLKAYNHLIAGAGAGGFAATCTIPLDVVKTRLQTQAALPMAERKYTGVWQAFRTVYAEEGFAGFMTGLGPRLMYLMPAAALTFTAYEQYKHILGIP